MHSMPHYLPNDTYDQILDDLETVHLTSMPEELRTRIVIILGEIGDIWPASCFTGDDSYPVMQ